MNRSMAVKLTLMVMPIGLALTLLLTIPRAADGDGLPDVKWGATLLRSINETTGLAIAAIGAGDRPGIDTLRRRIADTWQVFVDQEREIFGGEIARPESLRIMINKTSDDIQRLAGVDIDVDAAAIRGIMDEIRASTDAVLRYISKPVLLVFLGAKCKSWPNCKAGQRTMESVDNIASKYKTRVRIAIIDALKKKKLTRKYGIMLAPTLVLFDSIGIEVFRKTGETTEWLIEEPLDKLLSE